MDKEHLATEIKDRVPSMLPPVLGKQKSGSPVGVKERQEATTRSYITMFWKQRTCNHF